MDYGKLYPESQLELSLEDNQPKDWFLMKGRKTCPVCRFQKTYHGIICPSCHKAGYRSDAGKIRRGLK